MPSCLKHYCFDPVNPPATFLDFVTHDLLVMLGMLVGHAGGLAGVASPMMFEEMHTYRHTRTTQIT